MPPTSSDETPQQTESAETQFVSVGKIDELSEGEGRSYDVQDRAIAVFLVDGQLYAIEDQCPHMGAALSAGHLEGCQVSCPWHAWRFDIRDGAWCDSPQVKIDAFETRIVDGEIQIATTPKKISE